MVPSRPFPLTFHLSLTRTVPSRRENTFRCTLPCRPVEKISTYRPVPSTKPAPTVPSRRQNLHLRHSPLSKPVPTVPPRRQNLPLPSRPAIAVTCSRQHTVNTMNNFRNLLDIRLGKSALKSYLKIDRKSALRLSCLRRMRTDFYLGVFSPRGNTKELTLRKLRIVLRSSARQGCQETAF